MNAKIMLYKNDGESPDGFPLKIVCSANRKTRRKTIGYATDKNWDDLSNRPKPSHPDFEFLFGLCMDIEKQNVKASFRALENFDAAFGILTGSNNVRPMGVSEYFDIEIGRLEKSGRFGTAGNYQHVKKELDLFAPGLKLADVDMELVMRWKYFKRETTNNNTLRTYLGRFRSLYNKAVDDPLVDLVDIKPFAVATKDLHVRTRRKKIRYLDDVNLQKLIDLEREPISKPQLRTIRMALLQFYLGGLNLKDLYFLKKKDFYKDRVILSRSKLGKFQEEFDVKLFPPALEILAKMEGDDSVYFFPFEMTHKKYLNFIGNHNKMLWRIQEKFEIKLFPTDQLLNTNTFRHTFATRAKFLRIDPDIIRELMGHERNDIDTIYKDKYPEDIRDHAHFEIITVL